MDWSDVTRVPNRRVIRQFAWLCCAFLLGAGLYVGVARGRWDWGAGLLALGGLVLVLAMWAPEVMRWVYTGAMVVAFPIGFVVSQILLALIFGTVFLAVGIFLRLARKDPLMRSRKPPGATYWEPKETPHDLRRYLRQY